MPPSSHYDVAVLGGSYAGLSIAMALGRSLRKTVVIDAGRPANRFAPAAHNVITHDGAAPDAIRREAREQVAAYGTVSFLDGTVVQVSGRDGAFTLRLKDDQRLTAAKVALATGVEDVLPNLEGVEAAWGKSVVHCPYCHGYEFAGRPTGILLGGGDALEFYRLIANWTDRLTLFTGGRGDVDVAELRAAGATVVEEPIVGLAHDDGWLRAVRLADGASVALEALYLRPPFRQQFDAAAQLGCAVTPQGHVQVDALQATTRAGVYAAGDCATPFRAVSVAMGQGTVAGAMINRALVGAG